MHQFEEKNTAAEKNPADELSSKSDLRYANMDERKRRRMISNRDSARRCRMKKQLRLDELNGQVLELQAENAEVKRKIDAASQMYAGVESENNVLRARKMELTDRLRSLNSVLRIVEEVSGVDIDIPEIPEALTEPWRLPCPGTSITTTSDVFDF